MIVLDQRSFWYCNLAADLAQRRGTVIVLDQRSIPADLAWYRGTMIVLDPRHAEFHDSVRLVAQEFEDHLEVIGHDGHGAAAGDLEDGVVLVAFRNLDFEDLDLHCYIRPRVAQLELVQSLNYRCDGLAIRLRLFEYQLSLRSRRLSCVDRRGAELLDERAEGLLSGSRRAAERCYRGRRRKMWSWRAFAVAAGSKGQFVVLSSFEPNCFQDLMCCVAKLGNQNRALHQALALV